MNILELSINEISLLREESEPELCLHDIQLLSSIIDSVNIFDIVKSNNLFNYYIEHINPISKCCKTCHIDQYKQVLIELFRLRYNLSSQTDKSYFLTRTKVPIEEIYSKIRISIFPYVCQYAPEIRNDDFPLELTNKVILTIKSIVDVDDEYLALHDALTHSLLDNDEFKVSTIIKNYHYNQHTKITENYRNPRYFLSKASIERKSKRESFVETRIYKIDKAYSKYKGYQFIHNSTNKITNYKSKLRRMRSNLNKR